MIYIKGEKEKLTIPTVDSRKVKLLSIGIVTSRKKLK